MLIAHLIGGVIIFASFLLRMPQASPALSLFLTAFKSVTPVSFLQQTEDVFSSSPAFTDSPSFYSDIIFSSSPNVTELAFCYPPFQCANFGPAANAIVPAEIVMQEVGQEKHLLPSNRGEEKPASTPAAYFDTFSLLAPLCAILTLYLTYVSHRGL